MFATTKQDTVNYVFSFNMAQAAIEIKSKSKIIESSHTFDISNVDWALYPRPGFAKSKVFEVDDLKMIAAFYPHGSEHNETDEDTGLFVYILNAKQDDTRHIFFEFNFSPTHSSRYLCYKLSIFHDGNGRGLPCALKSDCFKSLSSFSIFVQLMDGSCDEFSHRIKKFSSDNQSRKNKHIHKLSSMCGDITLVVKLNQDEDDSKEDDDLYVPPAKKQKRNHNKNENDNENVNGLDNNTNVNNEIELRASRIILSSGSPVFSRMLFSGMSEQRQKRIIVHAKSVKDVRDMLYFMSTNELKADCNIFNVIQLASFYQMRVLRLKCIYKLIQNVTVKNFVKTISLFDKY